MRFFHRLVHISRTKIASTGGPCTPEPCHRSILQACIDSRSIAEINQVHGRMLIGGLGDNIVLATKFVIMYAKFRKLEHARMVFDKIPKRNVFLWNAIIGVYARNGFCEEVLTLFYQMQQAGMQPDNFTFPCVLKACSRLASLQNGRQIHEFVIRSGLERDVTVGSALVDMYAKCGCIEDACHVFDKMSQRDVVSWNIMIAGYVQHGYCDEALKLFHRMEAEGEKPDSVTIASVLPACTRLADLQKGREIHNYIARSGIVADVHVGNSLIDMYGKCGRVDEASQVFDQLPLRDVASWTAIIAGYVQDGDCYKALDLFHQMQLQGVKPDCLTVTSVLPACAFLAALQQGKEVHNYVVRSEFESDVVIGNALIDMYAKCGSVNDACQQFDRMNFRDVVTWNTIIVGCGMNGHGVCALEIFNQMQQGGVKPNNITFVGVLSACSHAGLLIEGWRYFDVMTSNYHITPTLDHYTCMVDLLARAGFLDEAYDFIKEMPLEPDAGVWGALLGACKIHCNVELGKHVAKRLLELEPEHPGYYVLLSNIYAAAGNWDEVTKVRTLMADRKLKKSPGCSWIDMKHMHLS